MSNAAPSLPLTPDLGPERPASSPPAAGLFPGVSVSRYEPVPGAVTTLAEGITPTAASVFRLAVHPELGFTADEKPVPVHAATLIGVRATTPDGQARWLTDQQGVAFTPDVEGVLWSDQWNLVDLDLSVLDGQTISIDLVAGAQAGGRGWLQVVGLTELPPEPDDVVARVRTTRGTHQRTGESLSRGNTFPLTCVPHGFNFLTPVTDARTTRWLYGWTGSDYDDNPRPALQALAFSHQPSPWIADRFAFQLMPWQGEAHVNPFERQRHFDHERELDRPHHYRVDLDPRPGDEGIRAEMTPTSHAAVFRFRFGGEGARGVVLDQPGSGTLQVVQLPDGRVSFTASLDPDIDLRHPSEPALMGYVYGETRQPVRHRGQWSREGLPELPGRWGRTLTRGFPTSLRVPLPRPQSRVLTLTEGDELEVVVAMSFISTAQAKQNLRLEVGEAGFDEVRERAHDQWSELLGRLEIDGGSREHRTAAWSNLARLYAWPNEHHEQVGSSDCPRWAHASPVRAEGAEIGRHLRDRTGAPVVAGPMHVNNGYWDTYRTCWPAYHLFTPRRSVDLLAGQVAHYREGGWMPRWCAPGYVDCMVGTSSDAIFADAAAHGITQDELAAYDSALRNATCASERTIVGRVGIDRGRFVGHVDTDTDEGFSWSMENANCDAALALWSRDLLDRSASDPVLGERAEEFAANARWLAHRSLGWQTLFDDRTGFLQGRRPDGSWRWDTDEYDPERWGDDYTETNGWGMAFSVPHDGAGLARALGGEQQLAAKLDEALATVETASEATAGSYPATMHERVEARALRLGMVGMSNQPAHHIPFMYAHTGQHHRTQWVTREILERLFVGSEIGQGYPGDEDNGEMSAWWLFAAFGFYPLQVGSGEFVITAPLFERMAFTRDNGRRIEVRATGVEHRYIQSVRVNGLDWHEVTLPVSLFENDVTIEVELGPEPSTWARESRPRSISTIEGFPTGWTGDLTSSGVTTRHRSGENWDLGTQLTDDQGEVEDVAAGDEIDVLWDSPVTTQVLTLTTEDLEAAPVEIEVLVDDTWQPTSVRPRAALWPNQTQAYLVAQEGVRGVRVRALADTRLRQLEMY
ncbi:GH92 family glycosyl hydrolase [Aestuariimicrobium soli]|uniref:GH92 family glycosyl hydrolase n=1 Tax=Aestuariimicrobium soli TaxID=2035834 RepID=UPI003EBF505B